MNSNESTLAIVVTHSSEPWEIGQKFFNMLDIQRDVDFSRIRVILVNDGENNCLQDELFLNRPYQLEQITLPKSGVSVARNRGIDETSEEWIMFCDFDDTFSSVYSLRHILDAVPNDAFDVIWTEFYVEDKYSNGTMVLYKRGLNQVFIHGKLYRTEFLKNNNLFFDPDLLHNQDSAFNALVFATAEKQRIGELKTDAPIYCWCFNENSVTLNPENRDKLKASLYLRNKKVCDAFKEKSLNNYYTETVARTIIDAYYTLNIDALPPILQDMLDDFKVFYKEHKKEFESIPNKRLHEIKNAARAQYIEGLREEQNRYGKLITKEADESIKVMQWLRQIEKNE